jgi:hypothetical protein
MESNSGGRTNCYRLEMALSIHKPPTTTAYYYGYHTIIFVYYF